MWSRCEGRCDERHRPLYAGKTVCERWSVFENFLSDMGPKPTPDHTIDRIDGNGNYEPQNCRWATPAEQGRNRRNNLYVDRNGSRVLLCDLVHALGLNYAAVNGRLKMGWDLERALAQPLRPKRPNRAAMRTRSINENPSIC